MAFRSIKICLRRFFQQIVDLDQILYGMTSIRDTVILFFLSFDIFSSEKILFKTQKDVCFGGNAKDKAFTVSPFGSVGLRGGGVTVTNHNENLNEAKQRLNSITRDSMEIPADQIGVIIGKSGTVIKELERVSSCQIWVDPRTNIPGLPTRTLNLQGIPTRVEAAKRMILDRVALHESSRFSVSADGTVRDTLNIPEEWVGAVIGKGGSVIKSIMQASGARIFIHSESAQGSNQRQVHITGLPAAILYAKQLITQRVPPLQQHRPAPMPPPGSFTRYVSPPEGVAPIQQLGVPHSMDPKQQAEMLRDWQHIYDGVTQRQAQHAREVCLDKPSIARRFHRRC